MNTALPPIIPVNMTTNVENTVAVELKAANVRRRRANSTSSAMSPRISLLEEPKATAVRVRKLADEPLLVENPDRFVLFPIEHNDVFKMYKDLVAIRWIPEEVELTKDLKDWKTLNSNEQHFIKRILGFFAGSDGIVNENLAANFANEVQWPEAKAFYSEQMSNETVHSETYSRLIDTYIEDKVEKLDILRSIRTMAFVEKKANWALSWMKGSEANFATRLMAFAAVEGIFFSGAFCSIFWFKQRGILPGLTSSNEFISRDEGVHTDFACLLYSKLVNRLSKTKAHKLIREAVKIEKEFITEAIPCSMIGMNSKMMGQYIEFVADRLLVQLGYPKTYETANPFSFMERISLEGKDNFFEKKVSTYALAGVGKTAEQMSFRIDADF
jgi:ribonucleotide reductase beta subunit family protein with ferritin-like domain